VAGGDSMLGTGVGGAGGETMETGRETGEAMHSPQRPDEVTTPHYSDGRVGARERQHDPGHVERRVGGRGVRTTPRHESTLLKGGMAEDCAGTARPRSVVSTMIWPIEGTHAGGARARAWVREGDGGVPRMSAHGWAVVGLVVAAPI